MIFKTFNRTSKKIHGLVRGGTVCIALTVAFALVGLSVAAWQDGLVVQGITATGNIDPVFTSCSVRGQSGMGEVDADVSSDGKQISIFIWDAHQDFTAEIEYEVENRGSLPVRFCTQARSGSAEVGFENTLPEGLLEAEGDTASGELQIEVGADVFEDTGYDFGMDMFFEQWNSVP